MLYADSVRFLYQLGNEIKTAKLGLERIATLLEALGSPHLAQPCVHVAGTNGKGSTCAMIEAALRASGRRTGLYTSPHLIEPTERIRIAGEPVSHAAFAQAFERVHACATELLAAGAIDQHPTYFESVTAMGFLLMRGVDIAVVEVGMGGRLDATNVVTPEVAVITAIDYDHQQYLGDTLAAIAGEKAGILKPGVHAVFAPQRPEAAAALEGRAAELGVSVARVCEAPVSGVTFDAAGCSFTFDGLRLRCPLAGRHQLDNATAAALALQRLGTDPRGIVRAQWPGRLERLASAPEIVADGAHNPAGARALAAHIREFYRGRRVWLVFGAMRDKDIAAIAAPLFAEADELILTAPANPRAMPPGELRECANHPWARTAPDLTSALAMVRREASPADAVFITGSLFLAGEARARLL